MENRIRLYKEIGRYFSPDGNFNEHSFADNMTSLLNEMEKKSVENEPFKEAAAVTLSAYMNELIDYLIKKNMHSAALQMFRSAIAVSKKFGLSSFAISPEHIELFMEMSARPSPVNKGRKPGKDQKRSRIFKAALKVFEKEGFRKATMDRIAEKTGIGKASVYRVFKNKNMLLDEMLREKSEEVVRAISQIHSQESDVLIQIKEMIKYWIGFISDNYTVYKLIWDESNSEGIKNRVVFLDFITSSLPMFKERIVSLNMENRLKTINFYTVFYGIMGYIDGVVIKCYRNNTFNSSLYDEVPEIIDVLFNGFVISESHRPL